MKRYARLAAGLPAVCRLGLATRGNTRLDADDVHWAVERGVNYLNWCGKPDGLSRAVAEMGPARANVAVAVQFKARTAGEAEREMDWILAETGSERIEAATLYYVESEEEWRRIAAPGGVWDVLRRRKREGQLRMIGLTSHQRPLAARWAGETTEAGERRLDLLMIRYNAAHRGAERDVFPAVARLGMPAVAFTGLRWRDLLQPTPSDPQGYRPPRAAECYRFCLANPAVSVAVTAPNGRAELAENLRLLDDWRAPAGGQLQVMREHGDRVRRHTREFP